MTTSPAYAINPQIDFGGAPEIVINAAPSAGPIAVQSDQGFFGNIASTLGGTFNSILGAATQVGSTAASIVAQGWLTDLAARNGVATTLDSSPIVDTAAKNPTQEGQSGPIGGVSTSTLKIAAAGGGALLLLFLVVKRGK